MEPCRNWLSALSVVVIREMARRYQFVHLLPAGTALFTKQRRASPDDGLITQSIRAAATAGVLLCFVEKPTDLAGSI